MQNAACNPLKQPIASPGESQLSPENQPEDLVWNVWDASDKQAHSQQESDEIRHICKNPDVQFSHPAASFGNIYSTMC